MVSCCIKILESKGPQMLNIVLICSQDHTCQVSSLAEEICSVKCSKAWKSIVLGKKSTVTPYSKTSRFLANILILKYISSFDQGLIMIHQGLLIIHQDSKVAKLGFCRKSQLNFEGDAIPYNPSLSPKFKICTHKKL